MDPIMFINKYFSLAGIAGLLALLSFFYYLWISVIRSSRKMKLSPPEVAGAWPILGHLPQLVGSTPLFRILSDMSDNYGPIFMVRIGMHPTIVVSSWEMAKECFTTNDKFLAGRLSGASNKYLTFAMLAFTTYGSYWREIRKVSTLHLLSHRRVELFKHVPYLEIGNCMKHLHRRWMKCLNQNDTATGSVKVDMSQVFGELSLNVVLKLVAGKTIFFKNGDNHEYAKNGHNKEEEEGQRLHKTIIEFFELIGALVPSDALPFLGWLDVDGTKKRMKKVAKAMDFIVSKWLEEHRHQRKTAASNSVAGGSSNHDDAKDFMDVLISVLDGENDDLFFGYSRDTVIKATSLNLIAAATDTTSLTLTWAVALLITNPTILRKARDELDTKVGKERNVEEHDINDLVYLQAIVKETLRMYPAAPLGVYHVAIVDCNIGGYEVRAGTHLLVNLWKLHHDPRVWSNPSEFKPERFLPHLGGGTGGETANMDFRGHSFEYLPFGSGRRTCPGIDFALQTVHMALARLLHVFDFDNESAGLVVDMTEGSSVTLPKLTPLEVYLRPRLPAKLY